jgi:gas vesicle protein
MKKGYLQGVITGVVMGAFAGLFAKPQQKMGISNLKQLGNTDAWQKNAQDLVRGISKRVNRFK